MTSPSSRMPMVWGIAGVAVALLLGAYGKAVGGGERVGFVMNFPARGDEAGGSSMRDLTGEVVVETDGAGFLKRMVQPRTLELASHVVRNVSDSPQRIRFEVRGLPDYIKAELGSRDRAWNPRTYEIERTIAPGQAVDFDVLMRLPVSIPPREMPINATVVVRDASSGQDLSALRVKLVRLGTDGGGSCCEP